MSQVAKQGNPQCLVWVDYFEQRGKGAVVKKDGLGHVNLVKSRYHKQNVSKYYLLVLLIQISKATSNDKLIK